MKSLLLINLCFMMVVCSPSFATIIHVPGDTTSIKGGIALAASGDTVLVAPGIYYEHDIYINKDIILGSYFLTTGDTTFIDLTIVDGNAQSEVFWIDNLLELSGFTIRNGNGNFSGGIWVRDGDPTITHNIITGNQCTSINAAGGGGINIWMGHTTIRNNKIIGNHSDKAGGGICISYYGQATISDNIISNNTAARNGGGIATDISGLGATITGNTITHNVSSSNGGGIACEDTLGSMIRNNLISDNSGGRGGGIYCRSSKPTIQNNTIHNNSATQGAGLSCYDNASPVIKENNINGNTGFVSAAIECTVNSNPDITGNIIADNWSVAELINLSNCSPLLRNNTFYNNRCNYVVWCSNSANASIINNLMVSNSGTAIYSSASNLTVSNNNFYDQQGTLFSGDIPPGIGVLSQTNANGDSCDIFTNIFLDPLLADTANGDFQITWTNWPLNDSTSSPAIDAGDPASPYDPDSTLSDIGAFYFNQMYPFICTSDSLLNFDTTIVAESADLELTLFNYGLDTLEITAINHKQSVFSHNWTSGSSQILPGDSMLVTLTFTPVNITLVLDTLHIENNDRPVEVHLSGYGKASVGIINPEELPKTYALYPAYPNPLNNITTISFYLPKTSDVSLIIYNSLGQEVIQLVSGRFSEGRHKYIWDPGTMANGVYFYRLRADDYNNVKKIILER